MLRLYEYNNTLRCLMFLERAGNVKITREINGEYALSFTYPYDEKAKSIRENRIIRCEEQLFRIIKVNKSSDGARTLNIEANHVYNADAQEVHLQNVPDFIGKSPYEVLRFAFANTQFTLIDDEELSKLGLRRVDYDGFRIDFFSMDKTTPFEVMNTVIENCGKGEIYIDNYKIALVERIGKNTDMKLKLNENMQNVTVERDITNMITRLYPYGYEDLHIGSVNGNIQYIDSPNIGIYGIKEGYKDYSDYKLPEDVLNRALWEFSPENEERIDIPSINISGKFIDISKLCEYGDFKKVNIGDRVVVIDDDTQIKERIIKIETYPYEPLMGEVSIGRIKKDLFFYLNQMGKFSRKYQKASTISGKVSARAVSGVVSADGVNVKNSSGDFTVLSDMISISDSSGIRFVCGNSGGNFTFSVYDRNGRALYLDDNTMKIRGDILADKLSIGGIAVTGDTGGSLYINGKKILTQG